MLYLRVTSRGSLPTAKTAVERLKTVGHEERYRTANEVYKELEDKINYYSSRKRLNQDSSIIRDEVTEYTRAKTRIKELRENDLADVKGISIVTKKENGDYITQYSYYTDDKIYPEYYDNIDELKKAVEESEKDKEEKKANSSKTEAEKKISSTLKTNSRVTIKSISEEASSVLNGIKEKVQSILDKIRNRK